MMIRTLTLRNFRSHRETVLELDRFNFLRGPNGCGKSSIRMALEYLFTGRCELTDAAGRGADSLIRAGAKELEVSTVLGNGDTIRRRRTPKSQSLEINGKRVPVEAGQDSLDKEIGQIEALAVMLNAGKLADMSAAAQGRLMAGLVVLGTVEVSTEILDALCAIGEELPRLRSALDAQSAGERFRKLYLEANDALERLGEPGSGGIPANSPGTSHGKWQLETTSRQKGWLVFARADVDACFRNAGSKPPRKEAEVDDSAREILSPCEEEECLSQDPELDQDEVQSQGRGQISCSEDTTANAITTPQVRIRRRSPGGQPAAHSAIVTEMTGPAGRNRAVEEWCLRRRGELKNRIVALGKILKFFGPDGAVQRETRARLKIFEDALNQRLSNFGIAATLMVQPPEIGVARDGPHASTVPLRLLSASERFRFSVAFQIALAEITGIRLVVIDGAEILDTGGRRALTAMLLGSGIEQAIVLATGEGAAPPGLPRGVKFFCLAEANV